MAEPLHALFVPFPTEGHINGLLGLAQVLANHGLLISFAYPARSHALLQQRKKAPQLHPSVRLCVFADGLSTDQIRLPNLQEVVQSLRVMQDSVKLLTHELSTGAVPISCIVSDTFVPWTQDLANEVSLPRVEYWTSTATVYLMGLHLPELITRGNLPVKKYSWIVEAPLVDFIPGLPPFSITELPYEFLMEEFDPRFQFMVSAFSRAREAHMILVNSMYEMESNAFDALSDQIPICSVGPLFQPSFLAVKTDAPVDEAGPLSVDSKCLKWLDQQAASTVIYVSLGSVATFSPEETHGMALGLEASGYPFLWVIRADAIKGGELADLLPEGYLSRTAERSMIIPWAPQPEVLKHTSIGAFLTHCGWNSTLESLWGGKAMIACPRAAEQRSNARSIVDNWKVGVELERKEDGSFSMEAVEEAVKAVMLKPEIRQRALELQQTVRQSVAEGGISHKNVVNFLDNLKQRFCPQAQNGKLSLS